MFAPRSRDASDLDFESALIFPDLPPPVPPRKKITNQETIPDDLYENDVFKSSPADQTIAQRVSIDLITFEDDKEPEYLSPICSKSSENSSEWESRNPTLFQSINDAKSKTKQIHEMRRKSAIENLDEFFKDDLFKSPLYAVASTRKSSQRTSDVCFCSPIEAILPQMSGVDDTNQCSSLSEPRKWISSNSFQEESFLFEPQFANDSKIEILDQKIFKDCPRHFAEGGVIGSSTASQAEGTEQFRSGMYENILLCKGLSEPHVRVDLGQDTFIQATSTNGHTKQTRVCQYHIGDILDTSRMPEHHFQQDNSDQSGYLVCVSSQQYDKPDLSTIINTQEITRYQRKEHSDNEEDDYIRMGPQRNTQLSSEYKSKHMNEVDKKQQHHKNGVLESDTVQNPGVPKTSRRSILSQRSLSDSAIYIRADADHDQKGGKQVKPSKDSIKCKAKSLWSKFAKRIVKNSQQTSIEQEDWQTKLVCACGGSCERIGSLALSLDGHKWVAFQHCSWVSEYDHEWTPVRKFDVGGIVDCLTVSSTGVLYISCPMKKQILMLSKHLQLITMAKLDKLHPRGLHISPVDGTVIVCMTSETVGNVMKGPSNNCLMKFAGKKANEEGHVLNKGNFLGYPQRLVINVNGIILVSDFGLKCIFAVSQEGYMLNMVSNVGDGHLCQVHSLTCGQGETFYIVHGGRGKLSITRLSGRRGAVVENATSRRLDPDIYCKVRATAVKQNGQLAVTSGTLIKYVSLDK